MRISLRLIVSLIVGVTLLSVVFAIFQQKAEKRGLRNDLAKRAEILAESLGANVEPLLAKGSRRNLQKIVTRFGNRERVTGIAVFDKSASTLAMTPGLESYIIGELSTVSRVIAEDASYGGFTTLNQNPTYLYVLPLHGESGVAGALAIFHDASFIDRQTARLRREIYLRVLAQTLFIVLTTLLIIRWSILRPIARTAKWVRDLRYGKRGPRPSLAEGDLFKPLAQEVTHLANTLEAARAAAEEEARLRESAESLWTPERLRIHVRSKLGDRPLFVVSNREPYMHTYRGRAVEVVVPASGVVTALEPILRTCEGTWLAHGSGDADRDTVDERDRLRVPPDDPQYTLKRVWLSKEEEEGYYFGFSNEGLWPLCHIAHTRPTFRAKDWEYYQAVNRKFGQALLEEMEGAEEPCVLLQDYHFALLPRLVKQRRPDARLATFWHIPWPNPEAFGICPWQRELLDGLLGADLVGFHTQSHCNNFLQTVDRTLESRVNWERFSVERGSHLTQVRPFPISVAFAEAGEQDLPAPRSPYLDRGTLLREHGVEATFMGVGVERVDYTKGIIERFRGLERFLEKYPVYCGRFCLVQIGDPSRTHIKRYHDLLGEVEAEVGRINWRFQTNHWRPIVYLPRHHTHQEIQRYYKAADLCLVTSLHDGMNLVCKEFIAARDDNQGALILSQFAGASHQLRDALIVNPYDTEQLADAMHFALEMDPLERSTRMHRLRQVVKEFNIYRWAADLISGLSEIRLEADAEAESGRHGVRASARPLRDTTPKEGEIFARREKVG
jgi:trehalose 6-phosphate synthase